MALIVCTPGGSADNCYVTLAQADSYFANTLRAATWAGYDDTSQEQALIQATQEIEALGGERISVLSPAKARFVGSPYDTTLVDGVPQQALHFPRAQDYSTVSAAVVKYVPEAVRGAVIEQALWRLQQQAGPELIDHAALQARGVQSFSADGMSVTYSQAKNAAPEGVCVDAWKRIKPYVRSSWGTR